MAGAADKHLGVATCASTLCHGSAKPTEPHHVQQNEYLTWARFDPHSRSYRTLLEPRSKAIAERLNIGPAHQARICLDCHTDNVPANQRGPRFQLSDGVGCETCHGGSERWIASHYDTPANTHADNLKKGLYPIEAPVERARACLSCHQGNENRFADHRLMAAGHPRLSFELDTFTELWRTSGGREHFKRDADYARRKPESAGSAVWIAGLFESTRGQLALLQGRRFQESGALPEFALYNCYSCHRSMRFDYGRTPGMAAGLEPGALRLDDSRLAMLSAVFAAVSPEDNAELRKQTAALQAAAGRSRTEAAAAGRNLATLLTRAEARRVAQALGLEQKRRILTELTHSAARGDYPDYVAAEQAAMATMLLLAETGQVAALKPEIDALFTALQQDDRYDPARFRQLLDRLNRKTP